jgi:hypothetical protein
MLRSDGTTRFEGLVDDNNLYEWDILVIGWAFYLQTDLAPD